MNSARPRVAPAWAQSGSSSGISPQTKHRLFCHISQNGRGQPLVSHEAIINLIAATTTNTGLEVYARLDENAYPDKLHVTNKQIAAVNLEPDAFHPE